MQPQNTAEEDAQLSFQKYFNMFMPTIFLKRDSSFHIQCIQYIQCFTLIRNMQIKWTDWFFQQSNHSPCSHRTVYSREL